MEDPKKAANETVKLIAEGKIDLSEFQRRMYRNQKALFLPKLMAFRNAGNWESFINTALAVYEVMPEAFAHYEEVPDNLKYDFAISAYMHHGDSIPAVRKAVRNAAKYGKPNLPPDLQGQKVITVYRAGEEPLEKSKYRLSWTTDLETALFFLNEYIGRHARFLYEAQIKTADIIAYTDERNEKEIIQYRKVFNIRDITEEQGG